MLRPEYPIETERLLLRPYSEADIDVLHDIQSRPEVVRYLYWEPRTREQVEKVIRESSDQIDGEGGALTLAIQPRGSDTMVGDVVLMYHSEVHRQGEIGYVLHPDHQGHGYATEAAREMLRLGFEQLGLHRIAGRLEARNSKACRSGAGAPGHASRGAPARERVGERRVAERAGVRDAGDGVGEPAVTEAAGAARTVAAILRHAAAERDGLVSVRTDGDELVVASPGETSLLMARLPLPGDGLDGSFAPPTGDPPPDADAMSLSAARTGLAVQLGRRRLTLRRIADGPVEVEWVWPATAPAVEAVVSRDRLLEALPAGEGRITFVGADRQLLLQAGRGESRVPLKNRTRRRKTSAWRSRSTSCGDWWRRPAPTSPSSWPTCARSRS